MYIDLLRYINFRQTVLPQQQQQKIDCRLGSLYWPLDKIKKTKSSHNLNKVLEPCRKRFQRVLKRLK